MNSRERQNFLSVQQTKSFWAFLWFMRKADWNISCHIALFDISANLKNIDIDIDKESLENIDIDIDIDKHNLKNIDIDIDMAILENIDIDKGILQNIDIDKISYRLGFGISNTPSHTHNNTMLQKAFQMSRS